GVEGELGVDLVDHGLAAELVDGLVEHLAEELEADGGDGAALLGAEEVAGAAELEVEGGDLEAGAKLGVALQGLDAGAGLVGHGVGRGDDEVAVGPLLGAADAAAELVELGQAEVVGAVDEDGVGPGDVEAALDDGGGAEDVVAALDEVEHRLL